MSFDILDLISKLSEAILSAPKKSDNTATDIKKVGYNAINAQNPKNPQSDGTVYRRGETFVSPKNSMVELLRRHDATSKKIDDDAKKDK